MSEDKLRHGVGMDVEELQAQLLGLRQVLAMVITSLPAGHDLADRLRDVETKMRQQNAHAGMIEVVRSYREFLETPLSFGDAQK